MRGHHSTVFVIDAASLLVVATMQVARIGERASSFNSKVDAG
jgi:hypothetical protein